MSARDRSTFHRCLEHWRVRSEGRTWAAGSAGAVPQGSPAAGRAFLRSHPPLEAGSRLQRPSSPAASLGDKWTPLCWCPLPLSLCCGPTSGIRSLCQEQLKEGGRGDQGRLALRYPAFSSQTHTFWSSHLLESSPNDLFWCNSKTNKQTKQQYL